MTPRESGAAPQVATVVLGLRVRENSARAYFGLTEEGRIPTMLSAAGQAAPGEATSFRTGLGAEVWLDHLYLGDGWWYMPRERVVVQIDAPGVSEEMELGGIARSSVSWRDGNSQFRPDQDVDQHETRDASISRDWAFHHWNPSPLAADVAHTVTIVPRDHDVWVGRCGACTPTTPASSTSTTRRASCTGGRLPHSTTASRGSRCGRSGKKQSGSGT